MAETLRWVGQRALLLELNTLAEVVAVHRELIEDPLPGQREAVAASRTLLLDFRSRRDAAAAVRSLRRRKTRSAPESAGEQMEIPVHYGGEDLNAAAEAVGLSAEALIRWHTSTEWVGAFGGFAPGFTYCAPAETLRRRRPKRSRVAPVPRHAEPRTRVPAGSVALAGEFSAVYPRSSPGGWQLIGLTDAQLWDESRSQPALIRPGDTVRYTARREAISVPEPDPGRRRAAAAAADPALEVTDPGVQTLVQDTGRPGFSDLGVPRSGAADLTAARQANQLVGNDDAAPVLEVLYGGLELTARQTLVLAVTGAEVEPEILTDQEQQTSNMALHGTGAARPETPQQHSRSVPARAPFWMFPGERLRLGRPSRGIRSYVAVSGGLAAVRSLGSAATDTLSGLGPAPVSAGEEFGLVGATSRFVGIADVARTALPEPDGVTTLRFIPGPRHDWFAGTRGSNPGLTRLQTTDWQVSQQSDRVGLRLQSEDEAGRIELSRTEQLESEPMVRGAIQVPPSGQPVLFLADHPVTGGYPVIGVVVRADLGLAAQLPPGAEVRFLAVDPDTLTPEH